MAHLCQNLDNKQGHAEVGGLHADPDGGPTKNPLTPSVFQMCAATVGMPTLAPVMPAAACTRSAPVSSDLRNIQTHTHTRVCVCVCVCVCIHVYVCTDLRASTHPRAKGVWVLQGLPPFLAGMPPLKAHIL